MGPPAPSSKTAGLDHQRALHSALKRFSHPSFPSVCTIPVQGHAICGLANSTPSCLGSPRPLLPPQFSQVVAMSLLPPLNLKPGYGVPLLLRKRPEPHLQLLCFTLPIGNCAPATLVFSCCLNVLCSQPLGPWRRLQPSVASCPLPLQIAAEELHPPGSLLSLPRLG